MTSIQNDQAGLRAFPRLNLTARETAILCLIAGGHTNTQAAKRLNISHHTVAQHIADMLRQAQASSRSELIARAYATGILAPDTWPPCPSGAG
jgi:DNA-binding CsgD family transcriptional regulator